MTIPSATDRQCRRVFCIGRNYADHIRELGNDPQQHFVVFMKPPSSLVPTGETVTLPRSVGEIHQEVELVLALKQGGRDIEQSDARDCIDSIALGVDLTLRDVQTKMRENGLPWESAKAFEQSALISPFKPLESTTALDDINLQCAVNGEVRQQGNTRQMIFSVERIISLLSATWTLREGDLIYTGTPSGVGPVAPGDTLTVSSDLIGVFSWTLE